MILRLLTLISRTLLSTNKYAKERSTKTRATYFITTSAYSLIHFSFNPQTCRSAQWKSWTLLSTYSTSHWGLRLDRQTLSKAIEPISFIYRKNRINCHSRYNLTQSLKEETSSTLIIAANLLNVKSMFCLSSKITTQMATSNGSTLTLQTYKRTPSTSLKLVHSKR